MFINFNNLKELFCYNIRYYRYLNNYSQEKLSELCSLSSRYITDIENGKHFPTIEKIEIIPKALNLEAYKLFMNFDRNEDIMRKLKNSRQYNQKN